jgi:hypothetical protein
MRLSDLVQKLDARKCKGGYTARCPAHEDKHASLSLTNGDKGVVLHCHAGCTTGDVCAALGIEVKDLFFEGHAREWFVHEQSKPRIVATYDYTDANGKLLYQVVRMEPKSFRQRQPVSWVGAVPRVHEWQWNLQGVERVLYNWPEIAHALDATVYLCEGEKDADNLSKLGLLATTNSGGASKWEDRFSCALNGRRVVILPDNDEPGEKHSKAISSSLKAHGVTHATLRLPGLPAKGDVSDWLDQGGTKKELAHRALQSLSEGVEFQAASVRLEGTVEYKNELAARCMDFNVPFLDDYCCGIHPTDLIICSAASGAGKTTLGTLLAEEAAVTGKRVYLFALEAHRNEMELRMLYREMQSLAGAVHASKQIPSFTQWMYGRGQLNPEWEKQARDRLAKFTETLFTYYRRDSFSSADITRTFNEAADEGDLIILDHLHYVDTDGKNENHELKQIVKAIRDVALAREVPVIVMAHLRKRDRTGRQLIPTTDDIHGSSDVTKVATKVVMLAPLTGHLPTKPDVARTGMAVIKDRYRGNTGHVAILNYDLGKLCYQRPYVVARLGYNHSTITQLEQLPSWAGQFALAGKSKLPDIGEGI